MLGLDFLKKIFNQPLETAKRRTINPVKALEIRSNEAVVYRVMIIRSFVLKVVASIYKPFKKIALLEKMKYLYFKKRDGR